MFCLSCELRVREAEDALMARLVPEPGLTAVPGRVRDERGHVVLSEAGRGFPGLCHCPLGEAHYAEVSR